MVGAGLLVIYMLKLLVSGSLSMANLLQLMLVAAPIVLMAIIMTAPYWLGLIFGLLTIGFALPLPILSRLPLGIVSFVLIGIVAVGRMAIIRPLPGLYKGIAARLMIVTALIVIGRYVYDRPGSIWIGERGGGREALIFVVGTVAFFIMAYVASSRVDMRKNLSFLVVILILCQVARMFVYGWNGVIALLGNMFSRPAWFLASLFLAGVIVKTKQLKGSIAGPLLFPLAVGIILVLGVVTPHRSRPIFAVTIVLVVSYLFGYHRRALKWLAGAVAAGLLLIFVVGAGILPITVERSLSIVLPVTEEDLLRKGVPEGMAVEAGWRSNFRQELYRVGFRRIRQHPIVGNGFSFTREELFFASLGYGSLLEESAEIFGISGNYHNSPLELGVFCGLPAALAFLGCLSVLWVRFLRFVRKMEVSLEKIFLAGIAAYLTVDIGQMLINGGAFDFFSVSVLLGAAQGLMFRFSPTMKRMDSLAPSSVLQAPLH